MAGTTRRNEECLRLRTSLRGTAWSAAHRFGRLTRLSLMTTSKYNELTTRITTIYFPRTQRVSLQLFTF